MKQGATVVLKLLRVASRAYMYQPTRRKQGDRVVLLRVVYVAMTLWACWPVYIWVMVGLVAQQG